MVSAPQVISSIDKGAALKDTRTSFRLFASALGGGIAYLLATYGSVDSAGIAVFVGIWGSGVGFGESLFDHRS